MSTMRMQIGLSGGTLKKRIKEIISKSKKQGTEKKYM